MDQKDHKERIMAAGLELFATRSYHQAGIREIARLVNMPTGSFHYYFRNKEDFAVAVLSYFLRTELLPSFSQILRNDALNARQKVIACFHSRINYYIKAGSDTNCFSSCIMGNLGQDIAADSDLIAAELRQLIHKNIISGLIMLIEKGQQDHTISTAIRADILAPMIFDTYEGCLIRRKIDRSDLPLQQFLDFLEQLL